MNRPIHFEIQADDTERAAAFYRAVFGWEIKKWDTPTGSPESLKDYYVVMTGKDAADAKYHGIDGGLLKRPSPVSQDPSGTNAFVCTMDVENLDETVKKVLAAGGKIAMPKFPLVGMGWLGYCQDTEGNTFGMMQTDPNAK